MQIKFHFIFILFSGFYELEETIILLSGFTQVKQNEWQRNVSLSERMESNRSRVDEAQMTANPSGSESAQARLR